MADALDSLNGLIIPLAEQPLLLPNVAVAELVGYRLGQAATQGPSWFPGWAMWRDQRVPLIDPGLLLGQPAADALAPRMLILNAVGGRPGVNFIAMRVPGIPRSKRVVRGEMEVVGEPSEYISQVVRLADEDQTLLIPDLEAIERALEQAVAQCS
ncbi:MAG: chemotaxis protein CheW [Pseudomonas sp.]